MWPNIPENDALNRRSGIGCAEECRFEIVPLWDVTQRRKVVSYRRFGTTYRSHLQGSSGPRRMPGTFRHAVYIGNGVGGDWFSYNVMPITAHTIPYINCVPTCCRHSYWAACLFKMGQIRCPETSVRNYRTMLSKIPKYCRSHLHRGRSLKTRIQISWNSGKWCNCHCYHHIKNSCKICL
jgi:hypothetical protein